MEKLPEEFNMIEIMNKVEERTPYVIVAFQECERMNYLTGEMKRSLKELDLGLKVIIDFHSTNRYIIRLIPHRLSFFSVAIVFHVQGELTITSEMEVLENALFLDQIPNIWAARAYPSLLGLTSWFVDLLMRLRELETWSTDFVVGFHFTLSFE